LSSTAFAQRNDKELFRAKINAIVKASDAKVGVGLMGIDFDDSLLVNGAGRFPMQSVYKFPLALAVLHAVDKGTLNLAQIIHIPESALDTDTWSPLLKDYPHQDVDISLSEIIRYTVSGSDNNGCDILFRLMGGTTAVEAYIHNSAGIKGMAIAATEQQMHSDPKTMYTNWCQPVAMLQLLKLFYQGQVLSKSSTEFLMNCMTKSENPASRIKGLLPAKAVVAHKTGTSGTDKDGFNGATNDVGIITFPDGRHLAIVIYVSDYKGDVPKGERVIAQISRLAWDFYTAGH
jgi:beta-lactamase class A